MNEFDLKLGSQVTSQDGKCGKLAKVAIDPESLQVKSLIVEEGLVLKRARVFPVSTVEYTGAEDIRLSIGIADLSDYPEFKETVVDLPASEGNGNSANLIDGVQFQAYASTHNFSFPMVKEKVREGVPPQLMVIERGIPITTFDSTIGTLENVLMNPKTSEITGLVVRRGTVFSHLMRVPISHLERFSENEILLTYTKERLMSMTENENVQEEFWNQNQPLSNETAVMSEITERLTTNPWTSEAVIEVINDRGIITLSGWVDNMETRRVAEEIAQQTPGVISVVNTLQIENEKQEENTL